MSESEDESGDVYEVEVEILYAGSTKVRAESADEALEMVEQLPDSEIIHNDMSPHGSVTTKGVYRFVE